MKTIQYFLLYMIVLFVSISPTPNLFGDDGKAVQPSGAVSFFQASEEADRSHIFGVPSKMPDVGEVLSQTNYPHLVKQFNWWANKFLKKEYLPSEDYVKYHIMLLPADKQNRKKDLAFLAYEISGKTYMIVQSGGVNARMWFFVRDNNRDMPKNIEDAAIVGQNMLDVFINTEQKERMPAINVTQTNMLYVAEIQPKNPGQQINHAKIFVGKEDLCFVLQKVSFNDTEAARSPMPDQWFSWEQSKKQIHSVKSDDMAHSPTNVSKEIKPLSSTNIVTK